MYVFEAKIASRGYHVFMNTTWTRAFVGEHTNVEIETNRESIRRDPYACAIRKTNRFFANVSETMGAYPARIIEARVPLYFVRTRRYFQNGRLDTISPIRLYQQVGLKFPPICVSRPRHHPKDEMVCRKSVRLQFRMEAYGG